MKLAAVIERHLDALARLPAPVRRPLLSRILRPGAFKTPALAT